MKKANYLVSDYFATGEGRTISIMVGYNPPRVGRDYKVEPSYDLATNTYNPGELLHSLETIALNDFTDKFGAWLAYGMESLTREEFIRRYGSYVPKHVLDFTDPEKDPAGHFTYHSQLHVNFS